jgi:hypothetical protein
VALSETYEALLHGVQKALWRLGGVVKALVSPTMPSPRDILSSRGLTCRQDDKVGIQSKIEDLGHLGRLM